MVNGSSRLEVRNNKRATARGSCFISSFLFDGKCERPLVLPLAFFSRSLTMSFSDVQITTSNTYVEDWMTYTQKNTDRATHRVQQHKHNVQMHSVTIWTLGERLVLRWGLKFFTMATIALYSAVTHSELCSSSMQLWMSDCSVYPPKWLQHCWIVTWLVRHCLGRSFVCTLRPCTIWQCLTIQSHIHRVCV